MFNKRVNLFMGHYGSGKTTVAVNYAIALARLKNKVSIYDLDIVNPYYRTVDALNMLDAEGVDLVVSPFAETNVDIPAMNSASYKMIDDLSRFAVVDIGGDDRGGPQRKALPFPLQLRQYHCRHRIRAVAFRTHRLKSR